MAKKKAKKKAIGKKKKVVAKKKVSKKKASKKKASKKKAAKKKVKKASGNKPPTKSEILTQIAEETELTRAEVGAVFESLTGIIESNLAGKPGSFTMPGLFKMTRKNIPAKKKRWGVNPFTQEEQWFAAKPASKKVKINPLKGVKEMV